MEENKVVGKIAVPILRAQLQNGTLQYLKKNKNRAPTFEEELNQENYTKRIAGEDENDIDYLRCGIEEMLKKKLTETRMDKNYNELNLDMQYLSQQNPFKKSIYSHNNDASYQDSAYKRFEHNNRNNSQTLIRSIYKPPFI